MHKTLREEMIMAYPVRSDQWQEQEIRCQFLDVRDFGWASGMNQAGIEEKFFRACSKWAPHCGLSFKKVQDKPNLVVKWGKLGRNQQGAMIGGTTNNAVTPRVITFSDDVAWTASVF